MAHLIKKVIRCRHDQGATALSYGNGQRPPAAFYTSHKVVCLDCGKELPFGWQDVDIISHEVPNYEAMAVFASSVAES